MDKDKEKKTAPEVPAQEQQIKKIVKKEIRYFRIYEITLMVIVTISVILSTYNSIKCNFLIVKEKELISFFEVIRRMLIN